MVIDFATFKQQLKGGSEATSTRGTTVYHSVYCDWDYVYFVRSSRNNKQEKIAIQELYALYTKEAFLDTRVARQYITGRVFSPSCAVLVAAGLYDRKGDRLKLTAC